MKEGWGVVEWESAWLAFVVSWVLSPAPLLAKIRMEENRLFPCSGSSDLCLYRSEK